MAEKKTKDQALEEKLALKKESSWLEYSGKKRKQVYGFSEGYKKFIGASKTERQCVENIVKALKNKGFKDLAKASKIKKGDKVYKEVKGKAVMAAAVGKNPGRLKLLGCHVDAPHLDLKPAPVYEDSELALIKTHYYGGIKKYHWVNTPLALQGVAFTKKGKKVSISIGEKDSEPKFIIPDLLPHLARDQMDRECKDMVKGEELNILIGNTPVEDKKVKEKLKLNVLKKLYQDYGLIEEDLVAAELELVPALKPTDIGLDGSMIGAYGQDSRACVYTALAALTETTSPLNTAVGFFVDKEEIGSVGNTGAQSLILENFARDYVKALGLKQDANKVLENSMAIAADVTGGMNPNYKDVNDPHNVSYLGKGVSIEKYGGGGGKSYTNDSHAEYMAYIRDLLEKNKIPWQTGELGKIDIGGGGTIGMFLARYGMDSVDAGPCILGMHSPCEVSSKADVYSTYRLYKAFLLD